MALATHLTRPETHRSETHGSGDHCKPVKSSSEDKIIAGAHIDNGRTYDPL
jgi:hypothetical protein